MPFPFNNKTPVTPPSQPTLALVFPGTPMVADLTLRDIESFQETQWPFSDEVFSEESVMQEVLETDVKILQDKVASLEKSRKLLFLLTCLCFVFIVGLFLLLLVIH